MIVAQSIADHMLRGENQELVVWHLETELLGDVAVDLGGLVASAAGAVELLACIDT
jgi:hypothetical protein